VVGLAGDADLAVGEGGSSGEGRGVEAMVMLEDSRWSGVLARPDLGQRRPAVPSLLSKGGGEVSGRRWWPRRQ